MPAQLTDTDVIIAEFHVAGVLTSGLSPAPTIDVISPAGALLVTTAAMTEQAARKRYIYSYTYPGVAGEYEFRISCAAANLDDPDQRITVEVGQAWVQALDAAVSTRSVLTAALVWQYVITGSYTAAQLMRGLVSSLFGKVSGAGGTSPRFRNLADTKNVISGTTDSVGNRTVVTLDLDE